MMKNTIVKIADKERTALQEWAIDNPDWIETERKQIEYLTMMRSICEPIENYTNYERKIIKNLGKEILIDKKNQGISSQLVGQLVIKIYKSKINNICKV